jgi:hypothetical protein
MLLTISEHPEHFVQSPSGISRFLFSENLRVGFLKMVIGGDFAPRKAVMGSLLGYGE